jgi:PAS domain S-box-containing protein
MAQSLDEVFTPSSLEIALKAFAEELALESMEPKDLSRVRTLELEHTCKDGSTVWVEINASFLRDTDGQPIGILGVSRDITDRRKSEEALRQSEEKYRTILKEIADSYFEVDLAGNLTFVNDATCRSLGYSREELVGMNYRGFTAEEDIKGVYQAFNEVHRTGEPNKGFLWKIVRKDGDIGFADASVSLLRSQGGEIIGFRGVGRDITERKQAEEKYQTIVRTTIDGFWLADMQGHFLDVNDAYCHLTGYSRDELLNMAITDVEAIEEPEETAKRIRKIKEVGYDRFETRHRRKEGEIIDVGISVNYLPIDGGRMFIFIRDVTERKRAEEERRQLEQKAQVASRLASVGEMAAGVAHEINNPLTGVMGYAQLLMDREEIPPDVRSDLAAINDGARRVAGIVQRLLVFSRQTKPQRKLVDINELIESTLVLRTYHLKVNNIKVATSLDHYLPETVADPGQIQQVLLNLIVNAETEMKLAHGKGKLTITTEKSDNTIKICVKDDGPGIKPAVIDRIFDPFFTTREVGQGTGLGLSLCYGIVAEHKGRIYAESQPGKGATFIVELPVVTEAKPPKRAEPVLKKLKKTAKARILVVDDEQVVRDVVNRVLTGEGHKVKTVDNVADALKKIESERYDLILLDIKMPGINGVELYKRIQKINKSLARRVAFITGDIMSADTEKFLSETKVAHIDKPFDAEQLIREVRHALTGGR